MIEVEIKVCVTDEQREELILGAHLIEEVSITDHYYDSHDYKLTTNGLWLRKRDGQFELKMPATKYGGFNLNKNIPMHEICDKNKIAEILGLSVDINKNLQDAFELALESAGYKALYKFVNTRKSYAKEGFKIDFDIADFGDFTYSVCEIELQVENKEQTGAALEKIYAFVDQHGICKDKVEGKIGRYIRLRNPEHYKALINSCKDGEL